MTGESQHLLMRCIIFKKLTTVVNLDIIVQKSTEYKIKDNKHSVHDVHLSRIIID